MARMLVLNPDIVLPVQPVDAMGDGPEVILLAQDQDFYIISRYAKKKEQMHRPISDTLIEEPGDLS